MSLRQKAEEIGIDYDRVAKKADRVEEIADEKEIDLKETIILPNFDMNGPIVDKDTIDYSLNSGVEEAMSFLDEKSDFPLSMLSGWDVNTLQFVAEDRLGIEMDHVGELGSQAIISGDQSKTVDAEYDDILEFRKELYLSAAADELTINEQGNISPVTGCTYGEGHRENLFENHPIAQHSKEKFSTEKLYKDILEEDIDTERVAIGGEDIITGLPERLQENSGNYMAIDLSSDEAVEALSEKLTHDYPLMGLKLEYVGGQEIRLTPNTQERVAMSDDNFLNYFQRLMDGVASGTKFELEHNPDISTDYQRTDVDISKEHGANYRASMLTNKDYVLLNVGDKPGDVLEGENTIFFDQEGYPSEEYVDEKDMESVTVEDAAEYSLIVAELMERHQK